MNHSRKVLVAYDISEHRIRRQVYKILKSWRIDAQKSVFECLLTMTQAEELFVQIGEAINPKTDSLIMAWIEPRRKVLYRGIGRNTINFNQKCIV